MPPKEPRLDTSPLLLKKGELAPELSDGAVNAWVVYDILKNPDQNLAKAVEIEKEQARSIEIAQVFFDFGGSKGLTSSALDAAPLVGLMMQLGGDGEGPALTALESFVPDKKDKEGKDRTQDERQQDVDYVRAIAGDIEEINKFINGHFDSALTSYEPTYEEGVNPWKYKHGLVPLRDAFELVSEKKTKTISEPKGVNLESVILGAASALVTLRNSGDFTEQEVLKTIYSVDKFYRPFLTYIGLDAMEMALDEEAERVRMKNNESVLTEEHFEIAQALLEKAGLSDPEEVVKLVNEIMSGLFPAGADAESAIYNTSGHSVQFGIGNVYGLERQVGTVDQQQPAGKVRKKKAKLDDDTLEFSWRVKSLKSIAEQVRVNPDLYIADLLGLTVKAPTYEILADKMAIALGTLHDLKSLEEKNSATRDTHIHVKGDDIVKAVLPILEKNLDGFEWHIDAKPSPNGYQVAKITFASKYGAPTPVELMFQTIADRDISRFGKAAHIRKSDTPIELRKAEGYVAGSEEEINIGQELNDRRTVLSEARLTDQSIARAEKRFSGKGERYRRLGGTGLRNLILPDDRALV